LQMLKLKMIAIKIKMIRIMLDFIDIKITLYYLKMQSLCFLHNSFFGQTVKKYLAETISPHIFAQQ